MVSLLWSTARWRSLVSRSEARISTTRGQGESRFVRTQKRRPSGLQQLQQRRRHGLGIFARQEMACAGDDAAIDQLGKLVPVGRAIGRRSRQGVVGAI